MKVPRKLNLTATGIDSEDPTVIEKASVAFAPEIDSEENDVALKNLDQTVSADPAILERGSLIESDSDGDGIPDLSDEDDDIEIISTDPSNQTISRDPVVLTRGPILKSDIGIPIVRTKKSVITQKTPKKNRNKI